MGGARAGRGRGAAAARSAQARQSRSRRAERLTIYGQSWGASRARGAALPGSARPQRQRAGQGASRPRRPGLGPPPPPHSAPCTPGAAFRPLSLVSASARSDSRRARPLEALWRARRGNKWARMPYEISKCRGPVRAPRPRGWAPALPACLPAWPLGHRPGVGGPARSAGRGGGVREPAGERPAALRGRRAAIPRRAGEGEEGAPKLAMRSGPRGSPRISLQGLVKGARRPGSRAGPLRSFKVAAAPPGWRQQVTGRDRSRAAPPASSFSSPLFPPLRPHPGAGLALRCLAAFVSLQRRCSPASPRWRGVSPKSSAATPRATIFFTPMASASS